MQHHDPFKIYSPEVVLCFGNNIVSGWSVPLMDSGSDRVLCKGLPKYFVFWVFNQSSQIYNQSLTSLKSVPNKSLTSLLHVCCYLTDIAVYFVKYKNKKCPILLVACLIFIVLSVCIQQPWTTHCDQYQSWVYSVNIALIWLYFLQ